ncbi:MAG: transketolase C-terminal domain-containing protein, partial [Anaerolineales bacterium]
LYQHEVQSIESLEEFSGEQESGRYPAARLQVRDAPPARITIAVYGYMAELARQAALDLAYKHEIFAELIVFSQLSPFRSELLLESLAKSGRLLTVEEGVRTHGWGAEVAAAVQEQHQSPLAFGRVAALDMPVPAAGPLEQRVLPSADSIVKAARSLASK